ncbi:MAG: mechanosensitive ion channel family protein [Bacteroidales bacterium]|nr:mechanosensitive ion channel family protein [Bacteroidales bacterium]
MFKYFGDIINEWLLSLGINEATSIIITDYTALLLVFILAIIVFLITKKIIVHFVKLVVNKSKTNWDDILAEKKVFNRLAYLAPAIVINLLSPLVLPNYPVTSGFIQLVLNVYIVIIALSFFSSFLKAINQIYQKFEIAKSKPIKGYIQIILILLYVIGGIFIISILIGKSPTALLVGLGTVSAVLILVFKDSILGLVGGIQLSANEMVKIGDWISMPKYGADGNVIDITLTTVKVQNWDKTITTVPTYALVTDYFKNWRGMEESGGRRIKRSINIDMQSVKFCTPEMLERYKKYQFVSKYVDLRDKEISEYNAKHKVDNSVLVNGRRQTNFGIFREYLKSFLSNNPRINMDMTFLVRHLQPTEYGIPIEIYVFSKNQEWAIYEDLQADIFDHIIAIIPHFDLKIFQNPSGADFKKAFEK